MKKIIIVLAITMLVGSLLADFNYTGSMRTRMALWNQNIMDESPHSSKIDSRFRFKLSKKIDDDFMVALRFEMGDMHWGKVNETDIGTDGKVVELKHAYAKFSCPMGGTAQVGLQAWADVRGLIFDDDFAAIIRRGQIAGIDTEIGWSKVDEGSFDEDDDIDLFLVNFSMMEMFTMQNVIRRSGGGNFLDMWFMPSVALDNPMATINGMVALNMGSYKDATLADGSVGDVSNFGYAVSLKGNVKNLPVDLGFDFLMASGDDGEDPESTSYFNTISSYYMNGLEYMGYGINDGVGPGTNPGNSGLGNMDIVVTAGKEVMPGLKVKGAFGMLNTLEGDDTARGMEFDLGLCKQLHEKVKLNAVGAFFMPNKDFYGSDEMVKEISTTLNYKF